MPVNSRLQTLIDKLSAAKSSKTLLTFQDTKVLADRFANLFDYKIRKLHEKMDSVQPAPLSVTIHDDCASLFAEFHPVSLEEVLKMIKSSPVTSCKLDPLPSSVFKVCVPELLPVLTKMVNLSLSSGHFPVHLKEACVLPLLKKPNLDPESLSSYRPISNLRYISKIIERIAVDQLQAHLCDNNLHAKMQSAYRPFHSTETALLSVQNDILLALDNHQEAVLVLLDFSSAFDTLDHSHLCKRLSSRYGLCHTALKWIVSYLENQNQSVLIDSVKSDCHCLWCGVPQGSAAGPLLFILFSAPLQDLIAAHGIKSIVYADDTQFYLTYHPADRDLAMARINACFDDIRSWSLSNKLALNDAKTEVIVF